MRRYPLAPLQLPFWLHYNQEPNSPLYNRSTPLRLRGPVDVGAFERAWRRIVERHTALRTLVVEEGEPILEEHGTEASAFDVLDGRGWTDERLLAELEAKVNEPFDLKRGPVSRGVLVVLGDDECVFMNVNPHVFSDISMPDTLYTELPRLLTEEYGGAPAALPPLGEGYGTFSAELRAHLQGDALPRLEAYWDAQLEGAARGLDLPADGPRSRTKREGASVTAVFGSALTAKVDQFAAAEKTSRLRVLLTTYCALLEHHTRQHDVVVGMNVTLRDARYEGMTGNFAQLVPIRAAFGEGTSFRALLRQVTGRVKGAIEHRHYPLAALLRRAKGPVYETVFNYAKLRGRPELSATVLIPAIGRPIETDFGPLRVVSAVPIRQHGGLLKVELLVAEDVGELCAELKYDASVFGQDTAERLLARYQRLLAACLDAPDAPLLSHDLLDAGERAFLASLNDTAVEFPAELPVHALFEQRVAETPSATAVEHGTRRLTYREVDEAANRLAGALERAGMMPGGRVVALLQRSEQVPIAYLACWKAGLAYVPVDADYPEARIREIVDAAEPGVVLTERALRDLAPPLVPRLEIDSPDVAHGPGLVARRTGSARAVAYVIFTSGSTGTPKGVVVEHRGIVNYALDVGRRWQLEPGDRVLSFASFAFDSSVSEWVGALVAGATLVVRDAGCVGGVELARFVEARRLTHVMLPPAVWSTIPEGVAFPATRTVVSAGDVLPAEIVGRWAGGRRMINEYGPTEITVCATSAPCVPGERVHIGRPIANMEAWVVLPEGRLAPIGVEGELCIAGVGLARGYLGRDDLTNERFVPCAVSARFERMYRTGDRARVLADGNLDLVGRIDEQVKLRGFRIELGEVESVLARHPDVAAAVAALATLPGDQKGIVAYVVLRPGRSLDRARIREHARRALPDYMVPSHVQAILEVPLSEHGKVDRRRLPAVEPDVSAAATPAGTTSGDPRIDLALEVFVRYLAVPTLGPDDDFFDAGGNSLAAVDVVAELGERLGVAVPVLALFQNPTARALVETLGAGGGGAIAPLAGADGHGPPLYLVYTAGGDVAVYHALAGGLAARGLGPVFAVRPPREDPPHAGLAELGRDVADAIAEHAPDGDVLVGGWSFGGVLATFVASALETRGRTVRALVLVDSHLARSGVDAPSPFAAVAPALGPLAARFSELPPDARASIAARILARPAPAWLAEGTAIARERGLLPPDGELAIDAGAVERTVRHAALLDGALLPHVNAPLVYVAASESAGDPAGTWEALGSSARTVLRAEGNHDSIVGRDRAARTAELIADALRGLVA